MGLDSFLARVCSRCPERDFLAREVSESTPVVLNSTVRVAFLGGVRWTRLAAAIACRYVRRALDGKGAVIEQCIPQNFARWQPDRRNEVVSQQRLFACCEAHGVRS